MPKVTVYVTLKPTLLDAQGRTVQSALHSLGFAHVEEVRIGKIIELTVTGNDTETARAEAETMCKQLLANPVTESYRIEVEA
ncbi:MAG: phosphoribosylformylglycinamidine synthase subunit PurS [Armatimonadaceae bacterium]